MKPQVRFLDAEIDRPSRGAVFSFFATVVFLYAFAIVLLYLGVVSEIPTPLVISVLIGSGLGCVGISVIRAPRAFVAIATPLFVALTAIFVLLG